MTDEEAQEKAEKVSELSMSMFKAAHTLAALQSAIELLYDEVHHSSVLLAEIVKDLPVDVQEKLSYIMPHQEMEVDDEKENLVAWIRRILKGGN